MNKRKVNIGLMLIVASLLMFSPIAVFANEVNDNNEVMITENEGGIQEETQAENTAQEKEEKGKDTTENASVDNQKVDENNNQNNAQNNEQNNNPNDNETTNPDNQTEVHKVAVITTKVDENGNPLKGALLQILDIEGNVLDEWISDGEKHTSLLPEGTYTLHEKEAPEGYKLASDKEFTVEVEIKEINADTDHDDTFCQMYPAELYYVESEGVKEEVYCINQGWDEPNGLPYDGTVLTEDNIKSFMPDADPTMTDKEIYHKVLDIIYHRSKIEEQFPTLTNTEIRVLTEYALKNYTSAMVQGGNLYRHYRYDPTVEKKYVVDTENGNSIGKLVHHYWQFRNGIKKELPDGTVITGFDKHGPFPKLYNDVFEWLIRDEDHHPTDMHLYIYSTKEMTAKGEKYQNLLGIRWLNPYDENHTVNLTLTNEKAPESPKKETPKKTPKKHHNNPQTGDSIAMYFVILTAGLGALAGTSVYSLKKEY